MIEEDINVTEISLNDTEINEWIVQLALLKATRNTINLEIDSENDCAYNNCEYLFLEDEEVGFCRKYFILTKNYLLCPDHRNKINLN